MKTYRWAIIGVGQISYPVTAALKSHPRILIDGVFSKERRQADIFAKDFKIPKVFDNYADVLSDPQIDVIYLAVPNHLHAEMTIQAIKAGKHVLCEKPIGINADQVHSIIHELKGKNVVVMEAMWSRFLPVYQKVSEILKSGTIGSLVSYEASLGHYVPYEIGNRFFNPTLGGGVLLDLGVYPLSLSMMLFGDITESTSKLVLAPTGVESEAQLTLKHQGPIKGEIRTSFLKQLRNDMIIYGSKGLIEIKAPLYRPSQFRISTYFPVGSSYTPGKPLSLLKKILLNQKVFSLKEKIFELLNRLRSGHQKAPFSGNGYVHQADALMDAIDKGHSEVSKMTLIESSKVLTVVDQCKKVGG